MPNLSRTVCIEKLTESVSIKGFSLSGMVVVSFKPIDQKYISKNLDDKFEMPKFAKGHNSVNT